MIKKKSESLADKIADVLSAVPVEFNVDSTNLDDTGAKVADFDDSNEIEDREEKILSKLRRENVDLLADVDQRYAGKKGSRKRAIEESEISDEEDSSDDIKIDYDEENVETDEANQSDDEEESDDNDDEASSSLSEGESDKKFEYIMSRPNLSEQSKKGVCVKNQLKIWENLLEMRIQMQKCLSSANKMPQKICYEEMSKDIDFAKAASQTKYNLACLLDKLLNLQSLVVKKYPETKKLIKQTNRIMKNEDGSDEEILSDDADDDDNEKISEDSDEEEVEKNPTKKRRLNEFAKDILDMHEVYKEYRNKTIENWNTKTRLSVTKNHGQVHSIVNQIEHILGDRSKLIKRTQLKRSDFIILGQEVAKEILSIEENTDNIINVDEYNTEIFDDTDFYHQLLRELIEAKSSDITDPVQLGRQWIQLQNLRNKMKRKMDTRATKGRKIRYAIHSKLVNFIAPVNEEQLCADEVRTELCSSLFGKSTRE